MDSSFNANFLFTAGLPDANRFAHTRFQKLRNCFTDDSSLAFFQSDSTLVIYFQCNSSACGLSLKCHRINFFATFFLEISDTVLQKFSLTCLNLVEQAICRKFAASRPLGLLDPRVCIAAWYVSDWFMDSKTTGLFSSGDP